ncbi:MAG: hypothetical protein WBC71_11170 [Salaquimonas sp.]
MKLIFLLTLASYDFEQYNSGSGPKSEFWAMSGKVELKASNTTRKTVCVAFG